MTAIRVTGSGGKSGGEQRRPIEAPDSLHSVAYAQVLDLISEGEIVGLVDGARSIFLNGTPLQNADATFNFESVSIDFRSGTQFQDAIPGFPSAQSETPVGVELKHGTDWTQAISNTELSAVRVRLAVNGLSQIDTGTGDVGGYRVAYQIAVSTDFGPFVTVVDSAFDGKTSQLYERTHRIDLPVALTGWQLRVRRLTENSESQTIQDTTLVQSFTTVIDAKLRYPMSSLVGLKLDARQFNSIPTRAYHMRGRIVRIPSNYDPVARTYDGIWDGTWSVGYTNNPAWVYLDLLTNDRYGLGRFVTLAMVDKWSLYRIAVYCDDMVDDGMGGLEPRFTCNVYLQRASDAARVMQDLASVFRGISYYAVGSVFASADMPTDPVYTYTQANVIDGRFEYQGSPRKGRKTVALVSWNDMSDMGRAKVEAVEDREGIARYGIEQIPLTAFGCTSQAQAHRVGKWALLTSRYETDVVHFAVGLDGALCVPGQIIRIADARRAGRRIGGRVRTATTTEVETDAAVEVRPGDRLTIIRSDGSAETRSVTEAIGEAYTADTGAVTADNEEGIYTVDHVGLPASTVTITVSPPFSEAARAGTIWAVESSQLWAQTFRVLTVTEREGLQFEITAVQHEPGKYSAVDYGTIIQPRPISVVPPSVVPPPANVEISSFWVIEQGIAGNVMRIVWTPVAGAVAYDIEWRRNNSEWVRLPRTGSTSAEVRGIYRGDYVARVRAVTALEAPSVWTSSVLTTLDGKTDPPPSLAFLNASTDLVFAIHLEWGFPAVPLDVERTEIFRSMTPSFMDATKLGDFAWPTTSAQITGLAAGVEMWFWGRMVDRSGNMGPFVPIGDPGVHGQSSASASAILDYLVGQITETQLGSSLLERIETGETAAVEVTQITNDLAALYTIKTQLNVNGRLYLAGIGVGVENNDGIIESQVLVAANRFAVLDESGSTVSAPFVIQGGQVFINSLFVQDASITDAKIVGLNASKIIASFLSAISANLGTVTAGVIRNSTDSVNINMNATGGSLLMRAGPFTYYGPYAGSHYPVEIYADGRAFFGRDVVAGGTVRASEAGYVIALADRPGIIFSASYVPPPESA